MLTVLIPASNEQNRIPATLQQYIDYFTTEYEGAFEFIVVCNGCRDRTKDICATYSSRYPQIRVGSFDSSIGKGGAIIEGFKLCKGDIVSFVDADGATGPAELSKLVRQLGDSHGVIGSRWLPQSQILVRQPLARRTASRGFNLLVNASLGLRFKDTQCGAKVFRREALEVAINRVRTTGFAFDVELLYQLQKNGYVIKEVPIIWENKGHSTLSLRKAIATMFLAVVRLRLWDSPFRWLVRNPVAGHLWKRLR